MFSLAFSHDHFIPSENSTTGSYGDFVLSNNPSYGSIINTTTYTTADNVVYAVAENLTIDGDRIYFNSDAENIILVEIDGISYSLGVGELETGQFKFVDDQIELKIKQNISSNSIVTYQRQATGLTKTSTEICKPYDPVLAYWDAEGDFNINHTFQGEPTTSFSFHTCLDDEERINQELCNGTNLVVDGISWVVDGLTISRVKNTQDILVTVPLKHILASRGNPSKSSIDIPLLKRKSTARNNYKRSRLITQFTTETNVSYQGQNIALRSNRNDDRDDTTTIREILTNRAIKNHSFIFFNSNGVEIRNWYNTKVHIISDNDIIGDFTYSNGGHGSVVDGINLHTEYRNLKIGLEYDQDRVEQNTGITVRKIFTNCRDEEDLLSPRVDRGFYFTEPNSELYLNPGINFDSGGRVKEMSTTVYFNGTATFSTNVKAGNAFTSSDIYDINITTEGNIVLKPGLITPQNYWQVVSNTTTNYIFDSIGYNTTKRITGQELARLQQESEKLEAVIFEAQAQQIDQLNPDPSLLAQAEAYKFNFTLPIDDISNNVLNRHSDFFHDTVESADPCNKIVEPKFVSLMARASESQIIKENPKTSEDFVYPLIVTGKQLFEFNKKTITSTVFPFKYEELNSSINSEGEHFKNAIALSNVTEHDGKPGIAPRLNRDIDPTDTSENNNHNLYKDTNYFLSSVNVDNKKSLNEGSKSYPDVDNPFQVAAIAKTELSIINSKNSRSAIININWRDGIEVGNFALIYGYLWKIFNIRDNRKIEKQRFVSTSFELTIGRYLISDVVLENRKEC